MAELGPEREEEERGVGTRGGASGGRRHRTAKGLAVVACLVLGFAASAQAGGEGRDFPRLSLAAIAAGRGDPGPEGYSVSRWALFPTVLVLDQRDFAAQDRMFLRLAFFVEKRGYRGKLLQDDELAGLHGWNAHDYGPSGLASFFTSARKADFPLNSEEESLRALALREGLIVPRGDGFAPGTGAVLSISKESDRYARRLLLAHESYHGIFFTDLEYRKLCYSVWDSAAKEEKRFASRLLSYLGYDTSDRELEVNEFQAYLLQQPASSLDAYVRRMEPIISKNPYYTPPTADEALPGLAADERKLELFLRGKYGIAAGGAYSLVR